MTQMPAPMQVSKWRRSIKRMFPLLLIAYFAVVLLVALFQRRLLYFPTKLTARQAELAAAEEGFAPWTNKLGQLIGWKIPANGSPTGSVLVIHGNAGCALNRGYLAKPIHMAAGVDVFILEYPGYGSRGGSPTMNSILAAAEEAFAALDQANPIFVVSESVGCGAAAHLAKMHPREVAGLMMFVPFDNLPAVAQRKMPLLPAYLVLLDRFQPAKWLRDYRGPVKIVVAEADEIIPPKAGRRLFDACNEPKRLQIVPKAGHNDVAEQSPEWWNEVFAFWQKNHRAVPSVPDSSR